MGLTTCEKKAKRLFERELKRWRNILLIDPIWTFKLTILEDEEMEHGDANVDIGQSEYYLAHINVSKHLLSLNEEQLEQTAAHVACHEMLHIAMADYQRAALVAAGDNKQMREELDYRYEQLVSRLSMILLDFDSEVQDGSACGEDSGPAAEVLRVPEMPTGEQDS